jgi:hypothetical protein
VDGSALYHREDLDELHVLDDSCDDGLRGAAMARDLVQLELLRNGLDDITPSRARPETG